VLIKEFYNMQQLASSYRLIIIN